MEQNGANRSAVGYRWKQLPERAELIWFAADLRDSTQPAFRESADFFRVLKAKQVFPNLIRKVEQMHDLGDTRAGKAFAFRNIRHLQAGRTLHLRMPLNSPMDRMYMFRSRLFIGIRELQGKLCHVGRKEHRMGDKRPGAPAGERDREGQLRFECGSDSAPSWGANPRRGTNFLFRGGALWAPFDRTFKCK